MADNAPDVVGGRYRILQQLGKGAMGIVYVAHDPVLDRKVAIKQMTPEIAQNADLRQRFIVEARAAAQLNHPNIVTVHELESTGQDIFIVMEWLDGRTLSDLVRGRTARLPLNTALEIVAQACDGLDFAHAHGVIHRDIKPANLFLVTATGAVKILDFGIARLGSLHMTATGAILGTPDFMAPEQVRGDEIDRRTDLWAVGVVLYELLSGRRPFDAKPLARQLTAITQSPHVPLRDCAPGVPPIIAGLVDRLLAKSRDQRPETAGAVRDELRAFLGREPGSNRWDLSDPDEMEPTFVMKAVREVPVAPAESLAAAGADEPTLVQQVPPPISQTHTPPTLTSAEPTSPVPPPVGVPDQAPPPLSAMPPAAPDSSTPVVPPPLPPLDVTASARVVVPPVAPPAAPGPGVPAAAPSTSPLAPPIVAGPGAAAAVPPPIAFAQKPAAAAPVATASSGTAKGKSALPGVLALLALVVLTLLSAFGWWYVSGGSASMPSWFPKFGGSPSTNATPPAQQPADAPSAQVAAPSMPATSTPEASPAPSPTEPVAPSATPSSAAATSPQPEPVAPPVVTPAAPPAAPTAEPSASSRPRASSPTPLAEAKVISPSKKEAAPKPQAVVQPAAPGREPMAAPLEKREEPRREEPRREEPRAPSAPRQTAPLTRETVDAFSGGSQGGALPMDSASRVAAINRVTWTVQQYGETLGRGDAAGFRKLRAAVTSTEASWLEAKSLKVVLEDIRVEVNGTEAVARCRRSVEGTGATGAAIREQGSVIFQLTRRTSGWVITDVR